MKANRLLSELMLLQARGRISTRELAERMEISPRTAHRDMEALCGAGVPLVAWRGVQGGWELDKGWRTAVPAMDEHEMRAMLLAQAGPPGDRKLIAAADRAFTKLVAAMPAALQIEATSIQARVHVDPVGWRPGTEDLSALPLVQEAVFTNRRIEFDYANRGRRVVEPLGLVSKQNLWYLVARDQGAIKTFRVSRIAAARVLTETFRRPARFDLRSWWEASTAELAREQRRYEVDLSLEPTAATQLERWIPLADCLAAQRSPQGWLARRAAFEDEEQAFFVCLGLGARVEVMAPVTLRRRHRAEVTRMAAKTKTAREEYIRRVP
jgi:predicted DNA-binding transcriptional regulator YafY